MAHDEDMYEGYAAQDYESEQWWLAAPEHLLVWARLRVLASGVAQVFDSQGDTLVYESEDVARGALMDADFRSLDGMDDDDAEAIGMLLEELQPPHGESDEEMLPQMIRTLGRVTDTEVAMKHSLADRHALVCGASEGIGRASAIALAGMGASVTVLARREVKLQELADVLPRPNARQQHGWLAVDVSEPEALQAKLEAFVATRAVHILVNNTAGPPGGSAHAATPEAYLAVFRQHLVANQILLQAVLPGMRAAKFGRIVNIISTSVKEPIANLGVSNTIRGAVASWAKTLASELGPDGITVNNVLPGYTRTQRLEQILAERARATGRSEREVAAAMLATVPAGRFAEAEEIAAAVAFLCSEDAGYVNGINLPVDGGRTRSL